MMKGKFFHIMSSLLVAVFAVCILTMGSAAADGVDKVEKETKSTIPVDDKIGNPHSAAHDDSSAIDENSKNERVSKEKSDTNEIVNIDSRINTLEQQIKRNKSFNPIVPEFVLYGAVVVSFLGACASLVLVRALSNENDKMKEEIKRLKKSKGASSTRNDDNMLNEVMSQISELKMKSEEIERKLENANRAPITSAHDEIKIVENNVSKMPEWQRKCNEIARDFNDIASETNGFEKKDKKSRFAKKYNVRAFRCVNFEKRVNNPALPPKFETTEKVAEGPYWRVSIDANQYALIPNLKEYENHNHAEGAMGSFFDSCFDGSRTYSHIEIGKVAIVDDGFNIIKRGSLILK